MKRHPSLQREKAVIVDTSRFLACTVSNLKPFYERYHTIVSENNIPPALIFNLDETSINYTQNSREHVIITRSHRARLVSHPDRTVSSTLFLCIPAEGYALDSTLLWPQTNIPDELKSFIVKHIRVYPQKSAYQTRLSFTNMMIQYYLPEMIRRREELQMKRTPILILLDGHTSRLAPDVIQYCKLNNISLLILPSHTSHITQPLDCSTNGVLKNSFATTTAQVVNHPSISHVDVPESNTTKELMMPIEKSDEVDDDEISEVLDEEATEEKVPPIPEEFISSLGRNHYTQSAAAQRRLLAYALPLALEKATSFHCMQSGWKKAGLYPYDPSAVLKELRIGDSSNIKQSRTPSISGKVLTEEATMIEVWTWRIQILNKELKKETTKARKDEIQHEISVRQKELEVLLEKTHTPSEKSSIEESHTPSKKSSIEKAIPPSIGAAPERIMRMTANNAEEKTPQIQHQKNELAEFEEFLSEESLMILDPSYRAALLARSTEKRLAAVEAEDALTEGTNYEHEDIQVKPRYERRAGRGQKRMPPDMMTW